MEETLYDVEIVYIQNASANDYTVECIGRHRQSVKLNFQDAEGIEISAPKSVEIKNSYIQMAEGESKMWNIRFTYPTTLVIRFTGKIIIEVG